MEFGRLHSTVCTPGHRRINPYYVGLKVFEDIEKRFGHEKVFEVREMENNGFFLRGYLTEALCKDLGLFVYEPKDEEWKITDKQWERVRDALCDAMTNFGHPYIVVEDGDYKGRRELYLRHQHDGRDLDVPYAERTLQYVHQIWGPVHLETEVEGKAVRLTCEGEKVRRETI